MRRFPAIVLLLGAARIASADDQAPRRRHLRQQPAKTPQPAPPVEDQPAGAGRRRRSSSPARSSAASLMVRAKRVCPATYIQIKGGPDGDQTLATRARRHVQADARAGHVRAPVHDARLHRRDAQDHDRREARRSPLGDIVARDDPAKAKEETIEVFDTIDTHKSSAVLAERRAAATVSDAVSAEQISRSPDSNGADAAKRMVAATVQDNRYIVIRGLGGRYSLTLLNGVPLPSPDPDMPAAPLDLFPASLITNLTVNKTFSPDMPATSPAAHSASRRARIRRASRSRRRSASRTTRSRRGATLNEQNGGSLDVLGFDDGTRALPSTISDTKLATGSNAEIASFKNTWTLEHGTAGPNLSLGATLGDTQQDRRPSHRLLHERQLRPRLRAPSRAHPKASGSEDGNGGRLPSVMQLDDEQGIEQANLSAIGVGGWSPKPGTALDTFTLYSHGTDISASQVTGTENNSSVVDRTRLQFLAARARSSRS